MKTVFLFTYIFIFFNTVLYSQNSNKFNLSVEIPVKVSLPFYSIQTIDFNDQIVYNAPLFAKYRNPVFGVNLGFLYKISGRFCTGINFGVVGELYEQHSFFLNEYYHRFMIPVSGKLRYKCPLSEKRNLLIDMNIGYQVFSNQLDNDTNGYFFTTKGGILAGIDIGTNFKLYNYSFLFKIGYEINQFKNTDRIDWGSWSFLLKPEDNVSYYTYYQVVKLSIELDF